MIEISTTAANQLAAMHANGTSSPTSGLRLAIRRGGCAGWQYQMSVAEPEPGDQIVEREGARVIVAADSIAKLDGCVIDYSDDLTDAGFKIHNPQAARSCGCGTSFESSDEPVPDEQLAGSEDCATR